MVPARRLLLLLGLAVVLGGAWLAPLDSNASQHAQAGLKRALASFATARALNAVISVVQGTEVAVQPAGVGIVFTPGQVLDPVNDLVEQFSALMLAASVAFGLQIALIKFGGYWAVSLALSAFALAWVAANWRRWSAPGWLTRMLVGMLLVRFAVPLVVLGSEAGFRLFLENDYAAGQSSIELSTSRFASLSPPAPAPKADDSLPERFRQWWSQNADVGKRIDELKEVAGRAVEHIVKLIVVFLLQTLVVPLLLFWVLFRIGRALAGIPARSP
ncbi:MAG TPA: hypothetical protein VFV55_11625 [Usitatibacteraceae bacterium]|nr:hypothetical protein [Usitatibacteraceae bacterium]